MEGSSTQHEAAGSAIGYLYQTLWPLLNMAQKANTEPGLTLSLELLDDVQFDDHGTPIELIQTKHHSDGNGDLGDSGVDLWRTINVWISALGQLSPDETPSLVMVTTAEAPPGSAAQFLRNDGDRDVERALRALETAASTSINQRTEPWRQRFLNLAAPIRADLVGAITLADGEVEIGDIDNELKSAFVWVLPSDSKADAFIDHVKGWWFRIAVSLLRREIRAFAASDMLMAIRDIRDQYLPDNLPRDPSLPEPDQSTIDGYMSSTFVKQLGIVAATQDQIALAIRDYYRAFTQRSRWLRSDLLDVGEIDRYEDNLVGEWQFVFSNVIAELPDTASDADKEKCGRAVLSEVVASAAARIRERYDESFMTRGSFHRLADGKRIGWHPEFEERLEVLIEAAVNPP